MDDELDIFTCALLSSVLLTSHLLDIKITNKQNVFVLRMKV